MTEKRKLTAEVEEALRGMGHDPNPPAPEPPALPEGHERYLIAVGGTLLKGTATPPVIAAQLRAVADQLDPKRPTLRDGSTKP